MARSPVLVLPDQLFERHPGLESGPRRVFLLEHRWYYFEHSFHARRLALLRASMRGYAKELRKAGHDVVLFGIDDGGHLQAWRRLEEQGVRHLDVVEPHDRPLLPRLRREARRVGITLALLRTPAFLSPPEWLAAQLPRGQAHYSMARFYAAQRRRMGLLLADDGGPLGGKWSYDPENRKRLPRGHADRR